MITPFRDSQKQARDIAEEEGEFVHVYVKCSFETALTSASRPSILTGNSTIAGVSYYHMLTTTRT